MPGVLWGSVVSGQRGELGAPGVRGVPSASLRAGGLAVCAVLGVPDVSALAAMRSPEGVRPLNTPTPPTSPPDIYGMIFLAGVL